MLHNICQEIKGVARDTMSSLWEQSYYLAMMHAPFIQSWGLWFVYNGLYVPHSLCHAEGPSFTIEF